MTWIKLVIHRRHDKVLRIADLTGSTPALALAAAVDWFRWVDAHAEGADTSVSLSGFREVTAWPDDELARAFLHGDVDWLVKGSDGRLRPTRIDSHFGSSEKRRATHAKQVAHRRAHKCAHDERTERAPEEIRREEIKTEDIRSATPRTREAAPSPPDPVQRAEAALRLSTGHDMGSAWRHALCTAYSALPGDPVTIHGAEHPSDELWARACEQAASEPGFTPGLPRNFCKYVAGIVQRCRLQGVWPHEHAQADRVFQPTVQVSMSAIEEAAMAKVHQRRAAR